MESATVEQISLFDDFGYAQTKDPMESARAVLEAGDRLNPFARVLMFSGGKDSQAILEVCLVLGVKIDAILHVNTGCGLPETTEYVRRFVESTNIPYIEADAGNTFENRVRRKGFYGIGTGLMSAHSFAFRELKRTAYRRSLADFRQRQRGRKILMINGARTAESDNRKQNMQGQHVKCDQLKEGRPSSPNWWVSPLLDWSDEDRNVFLSEQKCPINPVSKAICRSGECFCGTTQGQLARAEAADYSPRWGGGLMI